MAERIHRVLHALRYSRAVRTVVEPLHCLRRRIRQRVLGRHVRGFWRTTRAYAERMASAWQALDPAVATVIPAARFIGPRAHNLMRERTSLSPGTFVARIPDAVVVGHPGAVVASDRRLLWDLSYDWPGLPHRHPVYDWQPAAGDIRDLPGSTATLATMGAEVNYYHFLLNALPRVGMLRRSGWLAEADRILVSGAVTPWLREALALVGVPVDRLVGTAGSPAVRCRSLLAPALVLDPFVVPERAVRWLRGEILPRVPAGGMRRRILIDRSDAATRRLANLDELRPALARHGIETMRLAGRSLLAQAELFQQADLVIANHGAALANCVFCRPGTRIIALIPDQLQEQEFRPLAHHCGLCLRYLICPAAPGGEAARLKDRDLVLPPGLLEEVLAAEDGGSLAA